MKYRGEAFATDCRYFRIRFTNNSDTVASIPSTKIFPSHATPSVQPDLSCLVGFTRLLVYFRDGTRPR